MILLNGHIITSTIFPDKTSQVWHLDLFSEPCTEVYVEWFFESESEIMQLAQLKDLIDVETKCITKTLYIDYLPYARQDKNINNKNTFALHSFARLLNSLDFHEIKILDAHSLQAHTLISDSYVVYPREQWNQALTVTEPDVICFPDKGAQIKYIREFKLPFVYAEKVRDQATGRIDSISLVGDVFGKKVLILDDICDAGGTFIGLTKHLLQAGALEVNLFVTHGLFTKGTEPLFNSGIKRIFTKNGEVEQ